MFEEIHTTDEYTSKIAFFLGILSEDEETKEAWMHMALKMSEKEKEVFATMLEDHFYIQLTERIPEEYREYIIACKQVELQIQQEEKVQDQVFVQLEKLAPKLAS